ncbi:MAG: Ca-activated chloride channel family protein [Congregibacter sp.]|jgi:Ca-activated chloride channel family protein
MKTFKKHHNKTSTFNMYSISTTLVVLSVASSSGSNENKTAEHSEIKRKPVAINSRPQVVELHDVSVIGSRTLEKSSIYHSQLQHYKPVKWPIVNTENYQHYSENGIRSVLQNLITTFSIDVDTGSYTNIRRMINQGILPPADAIRIEEFINYFDYNYALDHESVSEDPFNIETAIAPSPWSEQRHIMRIGLKGFSIDVS